MLTLNLDSTREDILIHNACIKLMNIRATRSRRGIKLNDDIEVYISLLGEVIYMKADLWLDGPKSLKKGH